MFLLSSSPAGAHDGAPPVSQASVEDRLVDVAGGLRRLRLSNLSHSITFV